MEFSRFAGRAAEARRWLFGGRRCGEGRQEDSRVPLREGRPVGGSFRLDCYPLSDHTAYLTTFRELLLPQRRHLYPSGQLLSPLGIIGRPLSTIHSSCPGRKKKRTGLTFSFLFALIDLIVSQTAYRKRLLLLISPTASLPFFSSCSTPLVRLQLTHRQSRLRGPSLRKT